ncbi:MAG TPA: histidine kinase dimerization/phosphoacceptor domain -containing protein [Croceibacterium sp.]|jgi:PAS domain S-box-containing protein
MLQSNLPHASPAASLALALIDSSRSPVLLLDDKFGIVGASRSFCSAFGFEPDELEGKGISLAELGAGEWDVPQLRSLLKATFAGTAAVDAYEMDLRRPDCDPACIVLNAHKIDYDGDTALVVLTITDVTSARLAVRFKDDLLKEKEVLMQELQHRVANSLQIIASVLLLSARRVQSEETRFHLRNAHHRVISIATLQKQLAVSADDEVELRKYFQSLCESIGASMIDNHGLITLDVSADGSWVSANVSTSLGLIVTELVINALKHAFPDRRRTGHIAVDYRANGEGFVLSVTDNGVGIAAGEGVIVPGLGTGIVDALAKQLGATVETADAAPGTRVSVVRAP